MKHTRRHNITTVQQPARKEAAGSGGHISQMAYKAHRIQKKIDGSKGKVTYAKTKSKAGVKSRRPVDCKVGTC